VFFDVAFIIIEGVLPPGFFLDVWGAEGVTGKICWAVMDLFRAL